MKKPCRIRMSPTIHECVVSILEKHHKAMHYSKITEMVLKRRPIGGATPENSIMSILNRGKEFRRVGQGEYVLEVR